MKIITALTPIKALIFLCVFGIKTVFAAGDFCSTLQQPPRTPFQPAKEYAASGRMSLDENGILIFDYGTAYNGLGKFHNPYFISNYANALFRDYLQSDCRDETLKKQFLLQADFLVTAADHQGDMALWRYPFPHEKFDLPKGWVSGIGQARISSVLMRAFILTKDARYQKTAKAGMSAYQHSIAEGGVASHDGDTVWFEEYPDVKGRSYKVLNGHITALSSLKDYAQLTGEKYWMTLFDAGVAAVRKRLPEFDAGFTSYYSISQPGKDRIIAPRKGYNTLHVEQLLWLFNETGDSYFLEWASRFQAYETSDLSFTAKRSVDPKKHGPDQAAGLYGSRYWSDSQFPTWLTVNLEKAQSVKGFFIESNSAKASPRDFQLDAYINGAWKILAIIKDNSEKRIPIFFKEPINTAQLRLTIEKDNGNKNTTIQAAMPILDTIQYAPIANQCNYRSGDKFSSIFNFSDNSSAQAVRIHCPGWIIIPNMDKAKNLTIISSGKTTARFNISASMDMKTWRHINDYAMDNLSNIPLPLEKFVKISFGTDVTAIHKVQYSN